jgi:hypothetical protein
MLHLGRRQQGGASARVALASPTVAEGLTPPGLCERRVGRRRLTGSLGGFIQPSLQPFDLVLELAVLVLKRV